MSITWDLPSIRETLPKFWYKFWWNLYIKNKKLPGNFQYIAKKKVEKSRLLQKSSKHIDYCWLRNRWWKLSPCGPKKHPQNPVQHLTLKSSVHINYCWLWNCWQKLSPSEPRNHPPHPVWEGTAILVNRSCTDFVIYFFFTCELPIWLGFFAYRDVAAGFGNFLVPQGSLISCNIISKCENDSLMFQNTFFIRIPYSS